MKILVGISGGVDSAYAAKKLINEGHQVEGAVLVMHEYTELDSAREVAASVGIPLHEVDCRRMFSEIKDNFVSEYIKGRTPNPCIICNERVKFKILFDLSSELGFDAIATGHYASLVRVDDRYALASPEDKKKDQSYMLYRLPQNILEKLILPLDQGTKAEIRDLAREAGISAADRGDSQEICFLPEGNHTEYIESCLGKCPEGDFIDTDGRVLGRHKGIIHYTVGQRKGLGISLGERAFVVDINADNNTVTLSPNMQGRDTLELSDVVYSGMTPPTEYTECELFVKLRYTATPQMAEVSLYPDGRVSLRLFEPQKFAPGQSAVLYREGIVMLGGFIK